MGRSFLGSQDAVDGLGDSRFIPLYGTAGPIPLIASAFAWHNETGELVNFGVDVS